MTVIRRVKLGSIRSGSHRPDRRHRRIAENDSLEHSERASSPKHSKRVAVPFGVSVGDFLAVGKLIWQVTIELRENGEAAPEYQSLLIEPEALNRALRQLHALRPAKHELRHLISIQATALACQKPLQDFLAKISKFDSRLGAFNAAKNGWKGLPRRMQFRTMFREDVKQLRSALASHVATINLLLMTQTVASTLAA
ncbi:hypothetical protein BKA56DRAFT_132382 [Ilyonectria sp. MPI-CAGE-AT-0026]|nr:hypothetical protein BKA56DRAFT_132382 [Ilyonectria sp. MPI-CAGE-AT-0026]